MIVSVIVCECTLSLQYIPTEVIVASCTFSSFHSFIARTHALVCLVVSSSHTMHPPKSSNFCALNLVQQSPPFTPTKVYYCCECIYIYTALHCWVRDSRSKYGSTAYTLERNERKHIYKSQCLCLFMSKLKRNNNISVTAVKTETCERKNKATRLQPKIPFCSDVNEKNR